MKLADLFLNRFLYRDNKQNSETKDSAFVSADSSEIDPASIPSGGAAQDINTGNVQIDGAQLEPGTYPTTTLDVSNWGWGQTCAFVSATLNTVTWGAGTFTSADGEAYAISAGTTGVMAAKTYIYLDLNVSETVYQKTTTSSTSVGVGKVLVAVAENGPATATYMLSEATQIVGDNIIANTINASKITTGQLVVGDAWVGLGSAEDAAGVTTIVGNTVTTGYVNALSITATGQITAGSMLVVNGGNTVGFTPAGANAIFAGPTGAPTFYVTPAGALTATSVTITGDVTATAGSDWTGNAIASAYIGNLDASKITTGSLSVSRTDADVTQTALTAGANIDNAKANGTTLITGGYITTGIITASNITTGTLSAVTVQTSSGNERIKLISDSIQFYSGGTLRATLDGTSSGNGGCRNTGDFYVANNKSYWIASTAGGSSEYGGIGVDNSNHLIITCGTADDLYIKNNAGTNMVYMSDSAQAIFYDGINSEGNFNVGGGYAARFESIPIYLQSGAGTNCRIQGSSTVISYEAPNDHNFYVGGTASVDAVIDANIWTNGDLLADGSKTFLTSHPDGKKDKLLRYTAQESPEVILRHRGKASTDGLGKAEITLPSHFTLITDPAGDVTVNLTVIGDNRIFLQDEPTNERVRVGSSNPNVDFHYEVMAIRNGYLGAAVELDIDDKSLVAKDRILVEKMKKIKSIEIKTVKKDKKVI